MRAAVLYLSILSLAGCGGGGASTPERACLTSDRSPGQEVCSCVQQVADQTLSRRDQKLAAQIIGDPDKFREYQKSSNPSRKAFVERYRLWGSTSSEVCALGS